MYMIASSVASFLVWGGGGKEGSSFGVPVWDTTEGEGVGVEIWVLKTRFWCVI